MYKYIYKYMYVYIWEYTNPCKLTFVWRVFSLGLRFVYVQEVEKHFYNKRFTAQQKVLLHNGRFYCTAESFTMQ